ncbi:hypothetical protein EDC45_0550 [Mesocricetibacter intestinalis]|uniref:DUF1508 domain-containing protein n=1 Tax=Mesocricetibacter intestinalis TaxID=1521930 RepID=A0A4V3DA27_9PAST|nr:DUF1508 domain-containing protein [Mesocricetibacter intestinalis]TDQ59883.1 hypothetical protein EDC45_0550 [Mesocricetibacter intestinalis]
MYFEIYKDAKGEFRWRLKAGNHESIATSGEGYASKRSCQHAIDLVKGTNESTLVKDLSVEKS